MSKREDQELAADSVLNQIVYPSDNRTATNEFTKRVPEQPSHNEDNSDSVSVLKSIYKRRKEVEKHIRNLTGHLASGRNESLIAIHCLREHTESVVNTASGMKPDELCSGHQDSQRDHQRLAVVARITLSLAKNLEELLVETLNGKIGREIGLEVLASIKYLHAFMAETLKDADNALIEIDPEQPGPSEMTLEDRVDRLIAETLHIKLF